MSKTTDILRSVARRFPVVQIGLQKLLMATIAKSHPRRMANAAYRKMTFSQMNAFHLMFAKMFRGENRHIDPGRWIVDFVGRRIHLPLSQDRIWLDWDIAVSILGHDIETKQTYASLIGGPEPPELFIDVGSSYGSHSLLFLLHNIDAISFEPNDSCHDYFRQVSRLNGVEPRIESVALGDREAQAVLTYPENNTWIGSTRDKVRASIKSREGTVNSSVKQQPLDSYLSVIGNRRVLLKIDSEGSECEILRGARRILQKCRPTIIFESWPDENRRQLSDLLASAGYELGRLPWVQEEPFQSIGPSEFLRSPDLNFVAIPVPETSR